MLKGDSQMSKKEKQPSTPELRAEKLANKQMLRKVFTSTFLKAFSVCLAVLLICSVVYIAFINPNQMTVNTAEPGDVIAQGVVVKNNNSSNSNSSSDSNNTSDDAAAAPAASGEVEQAINLYKEGWKKATTVSSSITHTKTGASNYNNIIEAGSLSNAADTLMGAFMKSSEPNEAIDKSALPPKSGVDSLSAANVKSAEIKEEGNLQVVKIYLNDKVNPTVGDGGIGSSVNVIEESQITEPVAMVPGLSISNINVAYENVYVEFKVDKATGNMTYVYFDAPCILSLSAKIPIVGSIDDAKVGIECVDEYVITY